MQLQTNGGIAGEIWLLTTHYAAGLFEPGLGLRLPRAGTLSIDHELGSNASHNQRDHGPDHCAGPILIIGKPAFAFGDQGRVRIGLKVANRDRVAGRTIGKACHEMAGVIGAACVAPGELGAGIASLVADGDGIDTGDRRDPLAFKHVALFKPVPVEQAKDGSQNRDPANEEDADKRSASKSHGSDYRTEQSIANAAKNVYDNAICMNAGCAT